MADKRRVKANIRQLRRVKTWQLLVLLVIVGFAAATFLRLNNTDMIQQRDAVLAADKAGDEDAIQSRLYDLQRYVSSHMNTDTGPFYLEGQYYRDAQETVDAAKNDSNPNGNIYAKAEAVCKPQYTTWSTSYVQCFTDELAKYPAASNPATSVTLPNTNLYRCNYSGPLWSPDFAGWSTLVCLIIVVIIIARLMSLVILHLLLKRHYRGI